MWFVKFPRVYTETISLIMVMSDEKKTIQINKQKSSSAIREEFNTSVRSQFIFGNVYFQHLRHCSLIVFTERYYGAYQNTPHGAD